MSGSSPGWMLRPSPNENASLRLFCFPHAGASGMVFRTWPQDLPDTIEVCAIELPGRGRRIDELPRSEMKALVGDLVGGMRPEIDRPYAVFGHSFGALAGFEAARELQNRHGLPPVLLCVSGSKAPQLPAGATSLHTKPDPVLIEQVRRMGGTPEAVLENDELLSALLPAIRADYQAFETYIYEDDSPLGCPILAMAGSADHTVDRASLQAWSDQTTAGFNLVMFPGDHFYLFQAQSQVVQTIGLVLELASPWAADE